LEIKINQLMTMQIPTALWNTRWIISWNWFQEKMIHFNMLELNI